MSTNETTAHTETRNRTTKKVVTLVGAAAIVVALAALLGEWGWGEQSQAQGVVSTGASVVAPVGLIGSGDGTQAVEFTAQVAADPARVVTVTMPDAWGEAVSLPVTAVPSVDAAPISSDPAMSVSPIPSVGNDVPVAGVPTPSSDPIPTSAVVEDDDAHEHGVDDHAVEHSAQHDESEAVAHGRDDEAHARHAA